MPVGVDHRTLQVQDCYQSWPPFDKDFEACEEVQNQSTYAVIGAGVVIEVDSPTNCAV